MRGGGTVDLVGHQQAREQGTGPEGGLDGARLEHQGAGEVRWEQVRGELHAAKGQPHQAGEALAEQGLAGAWHALEQAVSAGCQGRQESPGQGCAADDHGLDALAERMGQAGCVNRLHGGLRMGGREG